MATTSILYVGEDSCRRIPVMASAGLTVRQTKASMPDIRNAFAQGNSFSAIAFHADISAPSAGVIWEARNLSAAPLVLFENPHVYCETGDFDLVIPALTYPSRWLMKVHDLVEASRKLRECSRQLRQECAALRSASHETRAVSFRVYQIPIDFETIWRGKESAI